MKTIQRFEREKFSEEKLVLDIGFAKGLATGEIISGTVTATVSVSRGQDPAPANVLNGSPTVDSTSKRVLLPVKGGVPGTEYLIKVTVDTTNPLKKLTFGAILAVI